MICDDLMTRGRGKGLMTKYPFLTETLGKARVTLIGPGCQSGWEEMEHLRGNFILEEMIQNEVCLGGSPTIKVTQNKAAQILK